MEWLSDLRAWLESAQHVELAALLLLVVVFETWERRRPARSIDRFSSLRLDVFCFGLALLMNRASTGAASAAFEALSPRFVFDSLHWLQGLPSSVRILLALALVDFVLYWVHRAQHRFEWLWRTHAWHHSTELLYWFSGFRTSFLHSLFYNLVQTGVPMLVFRLTPLETTCAFAIGLFIQFWQHTNLRPEIGALRHVVITPQYHRIHHAASAFRDQNFAFVFPIWDRLFGTQIDPAAVREDFALGLGKPVERSRLASMLFGV